MLPVRQNPEGEKIQQIMLLLLLLSCWRCTVLTQVSNRQLMVFEEILVPKSNLNMKIWGDKLDFENYPISQRKLHPYFPVISFTWTQTIMVINNLCVKQRVGEWERGCFYPKRRIGKSIKATGSETNKPNKKPQPQTKNTHGSALRKPELKKWNGRNKKDRSKCRVVQFMNKLTLLLYDGVFRQQSTIQAITRSTGTHTHRHAHRHKGHIQNYCIVFLF